MDKNQFTTVLGETIREYRKEMGLTIAEVAETVNMDNSHLGNIENGKHIPKCNTLFKLAAVLNIPGDFFEELKIKANH